jgi:GTP-binding protein EngB required for normal cell division
MEEKKIDDKVSSVRKADVIFFGNPGVGKSTILSSISGLQFKSGLSWGKGLTSKLSMRESPVIRGFRFGDTPGLADIKIAGVAAREIENGLSNAARNNREALLFFVVNPNSGRVNKTDLITIRQALGSIKLPNGQRPSANHYGVIVNKCDFLDRPDFKSIGRQTWANTFAKESKSVPFTTSHIFFLPYVKEMVNEDNSKYEFRGLRQWIINFPGIKIGCVAKIDTSDFEDKMKAAQERKRKEALALKQRLEMENQARIAEMNRRLERERRDYERRLQKEQEQAEKRKREMKRLKVGERVRAKWHCSNIWYTGHITRINEDFETCAVKYDDGDFWDSCPRSKIQRIFKVGERVHAQWKSGSKTYYNANISKINDDGETYAVKYSDGDFWDCCPRSMIQRIFEVGERVLAQWKYGYEWYTGRITKINADCETYAVKYEDGDFWDRCPRSMIQRIT